MSLLEETSPSSDYGMALITPLAFIAVDLKEDRSREAYNFATDCLAIKKYARMAGCFRFFQLHKAQDIESIKKTEEDRVFNEADTDKQEAHQLI